MIDIVGFCQGCFLVVIDIDGGRSADDLPTLDLGSGECKLGRVGRGSPVWTRLSEFADFPNDREDVLVEAIHVGTPSEHDRDLFAEVVGLEGQIPDEGSG